MTIDELLAGLASTDLDRARPASEELARLVADPGTREVLREPLSALACDVGAAAHARAFAILQTRKGWDEDEVVARLAALAKDPHSLVRRAVAQVADWCEVDRTIEKILAALLKDPDAAVRLEAVFPFPAPLPRRSPGSTTTRAGRRCSGRARRWRSRRSSRSSPSCWSRTSRSDLYPLDALTRPEAESHIARP
jgi:hypothetical protein